jgi:hypothetical protein
MKKTLLTATMALLIYGVVSAQSCPNPDFESWNSMNNYAPDSGWYNSNVQSLTWHDSLTVWSVSGFSGHAAHIQTAIIGADTMQAWLINSVGDPRKGIGGVPYSQQPTALTGYYRYNLPGNDSAGIMVVFKKSGVIVSTNGMMIRNATGSLLTYTPFNMPITLAVVPDTVIIAIVSSNLFGTGLQSGSWLEIDQLSFTGTGITQNIPDGNFDTWINNPVLVPEGWLSGANFNTTGVNQSTDAYSGSYSVQLVSTLGDNGSGGTRVIGAEITNGRMVSNHGPVGGLPYTHSGADTLFGYYKYIPGGTDSAAISVNLTHLGTMVGGNGMTLPAAAAWTLFSLPLNAMTTPDSMLITIQSSSWNSTTTSPGSTLKVDHMWLKSQPLYLNELSNSVVLVVYPNPANDVLNFRFNEQVTGPVSIKIYDLMGRVIDNYDYVKVPSIITLPVEPLPMGMYLYEIRNNGIVIRDKFIKK